MGDRLLDQQGTNDIDTPCCAAKSLIAHYGNNAIAAALHCIEAARVVGRQSELRFWQAVLDEMKRSTNGPAELEKGPFSFAIPQEWKNDDFLRRIGPENDPLDASILAALTLKNPQGRLSELEAHAHLEGRRAEALFWQRAQHLLVAIVTPSDGLEGSDYETPLH